MSILIYFIFIFNFKCYNAYDVDNMDLREIKNISVKMIGNFVNTIGLDGEYYGTTCNCPMSWGRPKLDAEEEFITPKSDGLISLVNKSPIDENTKNKINLVV